MKLPICPVDIKFDLSLTVFHQVLDVYDSWLYPLQDWWKTVNEMSNLMSTGQMGNFIFRPVN